MWYSESCCCRPKLPWDGADDLSGKNKGHRTFVAVLYTIALGRYSSHSGKIHIIQDADLSLYAASPSANSGIYALGSSLLHPLTSGWFASIWAEPLMVTSSAHPHRPSSIKLVHQKGWPDPAVPIISERSGGMWWKMRQWRFLMETRCHSETIRVPLVGNCI